MKIKIYAYQRVGVYNAGELVFHTFEYDEEALAALQLVPHSTFDVFHEIEPLEIDNKLAVEQLKELRTELERRKLQEKLDKLNAA